MTLKKNKYTVVIASLFFITFCNLAHSQMSTDVAICDAYKNKKDKAQCIKELNVNNIKNTPFHYRIIKETNSAAMKPCQLRIRLSKKTNEKKLHSIALKLQKSKPGCKNLSIFYYLPNMELNNIAWATTHFNPLLKVTIIGSSLEEDKAIKHKSKNIDTIKGKVLGKWKSEQALKGAVLILFKNTNQQLVMKIIQKDGSSSENIVSEYKQSNVKQYFDKKNPGEFYEIEKNGNLGFYSSNIKFGEAVKIE